MMQTYLWVLLLLLYSPIAIIIIYSFTEAKVLGNWTGFSLNLYSALLDTGAHHSLMNACINTIAIALIAATASTLLGSIAAIGIFNLKARSRKTMGFINTIPILNGDIITGFTGNYSGIYYGSAGAYYVLYTLRRFECTSSFKTDES